MGVSMPFANQLGARLHRDSWSGSRSVPLVSAFGERMQSSLDAEAQAAVSLFLNLVGDPADQQVAAQPGRRRRSIQPAPFDLKIGGRQCFEGDDPGFKIGLLRPNTDIEILAAEGPASFPAGLLVLGDLHQARASAMRYTRPRSSVVPTTASPSFFFRAPEKTPRTVCGCQPVAALTSSTVTSGLPPQLLPAALVQRLPTTPWVSSSAFK